MNLAAEVLEQGVMSFSSLFHKASNLLGFGGQDRLQPPPLDGEIIYCKNNVCVHPPANLNRTTEHHPGYLNIRSQDDEILGSTLILTWIPNSTLQKNPRSIENSPAQTRMARRSPRQEYSKVDLGAGCSTDESALQSPGAGSCSGFGEHSGSRRFSEDDDGTPRNNERGVSQCSRKATHIGTNVNQIHKQTNVIKDCNIPHKDDDSHLVGASGGSDLDSAAVGPDETGRSSESDSPSTEQQLRLLMQRNKFQNCSAQQLREQEPRKCSGSSSRSVASVEMDGDNLVVVTEEIDDDTFEQPSHTSACALAEEEIANAQNADGVVHVVNDVNGDVSSARSTSPSSDSSHPSPTGQHYHKMINCMKGGMSGEACCGKPDVNRLKESLDLRLNLEKGSENEKKISDHNFNLPEHSRTHSSSSSVTSGPDSGPPSPLTPTGGCASPSGDSCSSSVSLSLMGNQVGRRDLTIHNISFPDESLVLSNTPSPGRSSPFSIIDQVCGVFSVDLGQMRSLRIFYNDEMCTSGQLVIASRESQYKILHFHHGGLDRLVETFSGWKFLAQPKRKLGEAEVHCRHFSIIRPYLTNDQRHPEEGAYEVVKDDTWRHHMSDLGQIEDDFHLRKAIFFAGLDASLRPEIWPFLLHYYPYSSTFEEREHLRNDRYIDYQNIRKARESMTDEERDVFWKSVQCTVEKDVVRTDRSNPYFKGEGNPNIEILKSILLNYAVAQPNCGYTQGMSDLLAPVLMEVQNEVDAYWCFAGLMQKTTFFSSPKDIDMDSQLIYLRELLRILLPHFYRHLQKVQDGLELLFCHRWLLLCFKREFPELDALRMWEACWARYQTDYFHLFICVAIISVYGEDVVQQDLPADEMLLHFSSLSMHMSGDVILRKARGLMHQFRALRCIPCSLDGLCTLCSPGMWDSGHVPAVECVGNHPLGVCPSVDRLKTT